MLALSGPLSLCSLEVLSDQDAKHLQVDKMMAQCSGGKVESGTMDSLALEQERGITIMAKVTSTTWKGCKINLVDTPGPRVLVSHSTLLHVQCKRRQPLPRSVDQPRTDGGAGRAR